MATWYQTISSWQATTLVLQVCTSMQRLPSGGSLQTIAKALDFKAQCHSLWRTNLDAHNACRYAVTVQSMGHLHITLQPAQAPWYQDFFPKHQMLQA